MQGTITVCNSSLSVVILINSLFFRVGLEKAHWVRGNRTAVNLSSTALNWTFPNFHLHPLIKDVMVYVYQLSSRRLTLNEVIPYRDHLDVWLSARGAPCTWRNFIFMSLITLYRLISTNEQTSTPKIFAEGEADVRAALSSTRSTAHAHGVAGTSRQLMRRCGENPILFKQRGFLTGGFWNVNGMNGFVDFVSSLLNES